VLFLVLATIALLLWKVVRFAWSLAMIATLAVMPDIAITTTEVLL
jgi:hypothetical protein